MNYGVRSFRANQEVSREVVAIHIDIKVSLLANEDSLFRRGLKWKKSCSFSALGRKL